MFEGVWRFCIFWCFHHLSSIWFVCMFGESLLCHNMKRELALPIITQHPKILAPSWCYCCYRWLTGSEWVEAEASRPAGAQIRTHLSTLGELCFMLGSGTLRRERKRKCSFKSFLYLDYAGIYTVSIYVYKCKYRYVANMAKHTRKIYYIAVCVWVSSVHVYIVIFAYCISKV